MNIEELYPQKLTSILPVIEKIPDNIFPWISEKHIKYLDDRIHKIVPLTDYLTNISSVEKERIEFIGFIDHWTKKENPDLVEYTREYQNRYVKIRNKVEQQCKVILEDQSIWESNDHLKEFWKEFAYYNEVDSLFGMFLTSGRWYVNAMLPIVKTIIYSTLPSVLKGSERNEMAYLVARRVITPRYAELPANYDFSYERKFASSFIPILQFYDRKLLFLFEILSTYTYFPSMTLNDLVTDILYQKEDYSKILSEGIYPPFAWHEFISSQKPRKSAVAYEMAITALEKNVVEDCKTEFNTAIALLDVFKEYELNYNNYNYKGKFGLVSKWFYYKTYQRVDDKKKEEFLDAILLDRFYHALEIVNNNLK
ncbi:MULTISPECIES: hypothetical protein [unclassified Chryseobacterium]|uniref:hypothetical protein n=1 Tax=unclassified Chryseobacterium TaxID=2593645 RepID=UPI000F50C4CE|nr:MULTISPECIES: hypothetical protein [unclassified Chryseobacterium]